MKNTSLQNRIDNMTVEVDGAEIIDDLVEEINDLENDIDDLERERDELQDEVYAHDDSDLSDYDTDQLVDELESRNAAGILSGGTWTVWDDFHAIQKLEHLAKVLDKYSVEQIESLLPE